MEHDQNVKIIITLLSLENETAIDELWSATVSQSAEPIGHSFLKLVERRDVIGRDICNYADDDMDFQGTRV